MILKRGFSSFHAPGAESLSVSPAITIGCGFSGSSARASGATARIKNVDKTPERFHMHEVFMEASLGSMELNKVLPPLAA